MAEFDAAAWQRMQSQIAASQRRMAAINKKYSRSHGGVRSARATRSSGARATRGAGSGSGKAAPALLLKIHGGSLASVGYMRRQEGAQHIDSNMLSQGQDTKNLLEEFRLDTARHPKVDPKNLFVHVSFSRGAGQDLTPEQWQKVVRKFLRNIGAEGCQYSATRHTSTPHDHLHVVFSRSRPSDGKLVSMSNNRWVWRAATRQVEAKMGFTDQPQQQQIDAHTSDAHVSANRRASRRGTKPNYILPAVIQKAMEGATSRDQFAMNLRASGIEMKNATAGADNHTTGILFRQNGAEEWLAGSSISRQFSLQKIQAQIQLNQQRAQEQAMHMQHRQQAAQRATQAQQNHQRPRG